jgi:hypothetical protein
MKDVVLLTLVLVKRPLVMYHQNVTWSKVLYSLYTTSKYIKIKIKITPAKHPVLFTTFPGSLAWVYNILGDIHDIMLNFLSSITPLGVQNSSESLLSSSFRFSPRHNI